MSPPSSYTKLTLFATITGTPQSQRWIRRIQTARWRCRRILRWALSSSPSPSTKVRLVLHLFYSKVHVVILLCYCVVIVKHGCHDAHHFNYIYITHTQHYLTGIDTSLTAEQATKVFLHAVGTLASANKFELFPLAECLGLCFVTPIIRNVRSLSSGDADKAENNGKYLYEPKFRWVLCSVVCCILCFLWCMIHLCCCDIPYTTPFAAVPLTQSVHTLRPFSCHLPCLNPHHTTPRHTLSTQPDQGVQSAEAGGSHRRTTSTTCPAESADPEEQHRQTAAQRFAGGQPAHRDQIPGWVVFCIFVQVLCVLFNSLARRLAFLKKR